MFSSVFISYLRQAKFTIKFRHDVVMYGEFKFHSQSDFWAVVSVISEAHIANFRYTQAILSMSRATIAQLAANDPPPPSPSKDTNEAGTGTPVL